MARECSHSNHLFFIGKGASLEMVQVWTDWARPCTSGTLGKGTSAVASEMDRARKSVDVADG